MSSRILTGNCLQILPTLPAASFDSCITDPPSGETNCGWDRRVEGWIPLVADALKPNGSLWVLGSFRYVTSLLAELKEHGFQHAQEVIWKKQNGSSFHVDRFRRVHEFAVHFYRGRWRKVYANPQYTLDATARTVRRQKKPPHWSPVGSSHYVSHAGGPRLMQSVLEVRNEHGRAIHPTQKPVGLILPLLDYSCPGGGRSLDPFGGSGTLGVAAKLHGSDATMIEGDVDMVAKAEARLRDEAPLLRALEVA